MFVDILLILVSWAEAVEIHGKTTTFDFETVRMPDFYSDEELQMLQPALDGILRTPPPPKETERNLWVFIFLLSSQLVALEGSMKSPYECIMDTWHHRLADNLPSSNKNPWVCFKMIEE